MSRTISSSSSIGITITNAADNPILVTGAITPASGIALYGMANSTVAHSWTITNSGLIKSGNGDGIHLGVGSRYVQNCVITNLAGGTISGSGYGIYLNGSGSITNQAGGLISATNFKAIYSFNAATIVNGGILQSGSNVAAYEGRGGSVTNLAGGTISGAGGIWLQTPGTVTNAGTVTGTYSGWGAVLFNSATVANRLIVDPGAVFNGNVRGGGGVLELGVGNGTAATLSGLGGSITNFTTLQFDSAMWTVSGNSSAAGLGAISINGFAQGDTIDVTGFVAVSKTFASNALVLTNASNAHTTLHVQGTFSTSDFSIASDGTGGTDVFLATALAPLVYGQTIDETGIVATTETVSAGVMTLKNGGGTTVGTIAVGTSLSTGDFALKSDGSGGTDVIVSSVFGTYAGGVTLLTNPTTITGTGTATNTAAAEVAVTGPGGTAWTLTNLGSVNETAAGGIGISFAAAGTIINASGISADTSGGAGVLLAAGGFVSNQSGGFISGYFGIEADGAAATLVNQGGIIGNLTSNGGYGVRFRAGGTVTNLFGGTITGYFGVGAQSVPVTVVNAGVIAGNETAGNGNGVYLGAGGSVTNQPGGTVFGARNGIWITGAAGTVLNLGAIHLNPTVLAGQFGVYLADGGMITNGASGGTVSAAYIKGYSAGVDSNAIATITNYGTIAGTPGNPGIVLATGTVINGPSGASGAQIIGSRAASGLVISGTGTIINYGTISGGGNNSQGSIYYGVRLGGAGGISNSGTRSLIQDYVGVYARLNDTLTNAGTIASSYGAAGTAVVFGGGTNRLIIDPGAKFIGTVSGGGAVTLTINGSPVVIGTANGVGVTTMELASAATAGTLAGFGTTINNFASLVFDSGARWTVKGNASAAGLGTLGIGGFDFGDTIDLTGFVATSRTFASNALVLTNAGNVHETLAIASTLATGNFAITSDGTGGTDIALQPLLIYAETIAEIGIFAATETVIAGTMTLKNAGGAIVGTIAVGTSLSTGDFSVAPGGPTSTNVIVHTATGTYTNGVTLSVNPSTIGSVATISGTASSGVGVSGPPGTAWTLTNLGHISETGILSAGISFAIAGTITNAASGTVTAGRSGVTLAAGGSVTNLAGGSLTGLVGIRGQGTAVTVVNAGSIGGNNTANSGSGISLSAGGSVTNQVAGKISGYYGVEASGVAVTVVNAGTIAGNTGNGYGVYFVAGGTVTNIAGGTISGYNAVRGNVAGRISLVNAGQIRGATTAGGHGFLAADGGYVYNQAGGTIIGRQAVVGRATPLTLINAGSIGGDTNTGTGVTAYAGGTVTNRAGGTITGNLAVLVYAGGTVLNAGVIAGGSAGGQGVNLPSGGTLTAQSGGTISGGGYAVLFGAGYTSRLVFNQGAVFSGTVDGGNTIGAASASTLELTSAVATGTLTSLGSKYLHFANITVDAGANWSMASGALAAGYTISDGGTLTNAATLGSAVTMSSGARLTNALGGTIATTGASRAAVVGSGGPATLVNAGSIAGNYTLNGASGVYLAAGGSVTNQLGATISGFSGVDVGNAQATIVNAGAILGHLTSGGGEGVYLGAGGTVTNQASGTISGNSYGVAIAGAAGTVFNLGTISTSPSSFALSGVYLAQGGAVTNGQAGGTVGAAYIHGYNDGVNFGAGPGTLSNYGTIDGTTDNPGVWMRTGTVVNGAGGATGARITDHGVDGISIVGAGTVTNYGTIAGGNNNPSYYGVFLGGAGSIGNLGTASLIYALSGIYAGLDDTVTNAGTIKSNGGASGLALKFGGGTNRLIVDPGAVFVGSIAAAGTTTLELASASGAGTISGLGSGVTNFTSLVFDPGARWTVAGNASAGGLGTLGIGGFDFGDTIDLTGFVATSRTFASNALVLSDGGGAHATLAIQSMLATGNFAIASDGGDGTDIFLQPLLLYAETLDQAGIVAATETVNAGTMTLLDGVGTVLGTVAVGTSLSSGDFSLTSDGSGGTNVIVHTATGTYGSGITLSVNPTTIGSTATISDTIASGIGVNGPTGTNWTVTNKGIISESGAGGIGISLAAAGTVTNATSGRISGALDGVLLAGGGLVSAQAGGTIIGNIGVSIRGSAATVVNAGSIAGNVTSGLGIILTAGGSVTNQAGATISGGYGVAAVAVAATVVNAGSIGGGTALLTGAAVALKKGGAVTNQSGGQIIAGRLGIYFSGAAGTLVNAGSVGGNPDTGNGVFIRAGGLVTNQSGGTITGKYGVSGVIAAVTVINAGSIGGNSTAGIGVYLSAGGAVTNQASGAITGNVGIQGEGFAPAVVNAGSIGGNGSAGSGIYLAAGGSVTNQAGGTIAGYTGVGANGAATVVNAGTISGNATNGIGIALKSGGTVTNQSGGTIGGGADAVTFAAGFTNVLAIQPAAAFTGTVDGGNMIGATSISTLELASGASAGTLSGLGAKYINFARTTIDAGANWTLSGTNTLAAGATLTNAGTLATPGTLINSGTLTGNALNLSGGTLINQSAGLLTATYVYGVAAGAAGTVVNQGTITNSIASAIYLKAGGTVSNAAGALIHGSGSVVKLKGTGAAVSNFGQITATDIGSYGVYMRDGGLVTNGQAGTSASTASILGYYGVAFKTADVVNAYGTLINYGTVRGSGGLSSGVQLTNAGTVFNGQSGATAALIEGGRYGVSSGQGLVANYATIIADGTGSGSYGYGVAIQGAGAVINIGTASLIEGYTGVQIGTDGTVTNSGTIESSLGAGGVAVTFTGGNARLIDNPGAVFIGSLFGGNGGTAVMELASAASAGTIAGFGTSITNFTSLVFDSGARWTVHGNDSATGLGTLAIGGFAVGDTIELTGFQAVSRTFASNALVLTDGIGTHETLHIQGAFGTQNFLISSDGTVGTDIAFVTPPTLTAGGTVAFTGGGAAVVLDSTVSLVDPGSATLVSGTVSVGTGFLSGDTLNFVDQGGITGAFDSETGTLTLSGTATVANYETALASITYGFSPSNGDPTGGGDTSRTIDWIVTDGIAPSDAGSSTLAPVHVAPTITTGGTVSFIGGGGAVTLDGMLSVSDPDSANLLTGATISIAGFIFEDVLSAITTGTTIASHYNNATGTLTLSGTDTLADYQVVLRSIAYGFSPANGDPTRGGSHTSRTIDLSINDGVAVSNTGSVMVTVTHAAPTITAGGTVTFTGGGAAVVLDGSLTPSDPDSVYNLAGATVAIASGFLAGDRLNFVNQNNIAGMFDSATGRLTLSGAASITSYQTALRSITFSVSPGNGDPTGGGADTSRTMTWTVTDGVAVSNTGTSTLTAVHAAPTLAAGGTVSFSGGGSPVLLAPTLTVSDPDSAGLLTGATVSIGGPFDAGDTLNFINQGGITGTFDSETGTLTLGGTASIANYQTALESISYGFSPSDGDPTHGGGDTSRTINWLASDGNSANGTSGPQTSALSLAHVAPTIAAGGSVSFTGGGAAARLDSEIGIADPDSLGVLTGATISVGGPFDTGDTLNFVDQNGIAGTYDSETGTLTMSGTASIGNYQTALESITYSFLPANGDPTHGGGDTGRAVHWAVTDGVAVSNTGTSTVTVVHAAPAISAGGTVSFSGGGAAVPLDPALTVSDPDSGGLLIGATVSVGGPFDAGDTLNFVDQNGIAGTYDSETGTLTLSGTATVANYETALASIIYGFSPSDGDPTHGGDDTGRTILWSVNEGVAVSNTGTTALGLTHVAPTIAAGGTVSFTGGGSPVVLDPALTVTDPDSSGLLTGATVSVGGPFDPGDTLSFINQNGIAGTFDSETGTLMLSGTASIANYETALASITYGFSPSNGDPTRGGGDTGRTIGWRVSDGVSVSNTGTSMLTAVHVAPILTAGGTVTFTGGGSAVVLDAALSVSDPDSGGNLTGATISIGGFISGDILTFVTQNGITGAFDGETGTLTLSGTASIANYGTALASITYGFSPGGDPTGGGAHAGRTIDWTTTDGSSSHGVSNTGSSAVTVVHAAPTITTGGTVTFTGGGSAVVLDATLSVSDPDSAGLLTSATVSIGGFISGDLLNFVNSGGIAGNYDSTTGTLTLTLSGASSIANYQTELASITYGFNPVNGDPTGGGGHASRAISWIVGDGNTANGTSTSSNSTLVEVHVAPAITVGGTVTFTGGGSPVTIAPTLSVSDPDSGGSLTGATVSIGGFIAGDLLSFANQSSIVGSYDAASGILTLSGTDTIANYGTALASITYGFSPLNGDPTGGGSHTNRTVSIAVSDGNTGNGISTIGSLTVTEVHAAPTIAASGTVTFTGGGSAVVLDATLTVGDADSFGLLNGGTVGIVGFIVGDVLSANTIGTSITAAYDGTTGVLTMSGTDTLADYQAVLRSLAYSVNPADGDPTGGGLHTSRTVDLTIDDGVAVSNAGSVTVTAVHLAPTLAAGSTVTFTGGGAAVTLDPTVSVSDPDSGGNLTGATVAIGGFIAGDTLSFVNRSGITGAYNGATGTLTLSGTASIANYQTALASIEYLFTDSGDPTGGGAHTTRTIDWAVSDGSTGNGASPTAANTLNLLHVTPTITAGGTATFAGGGSAVILDPTLSVSDLDSGGNLTGATVSVGGFIAGDLLNFIDQNGITGAYNGATGTLTLGGTATIADYRAALGSITYGFNPLNGDPTGGGTHASHAISWAVSDGNTQNGVSTNSDSTLVDVHVGPNVTAGGTVTFTGGGSPVTLDPTLSASDPDSFGNLAGATISIGGFIAGDILGFADADGITGVYNPATGTLTLSGTTTIANYETALASITYGFDAGGDPTGGGAHTSRAIDWIVNDGVTASGAVQSALTLTHVAPSIATGGTVTFTGGGSAVALDPTLTVDDPDSGGQLAGATIGIGGFITGDLLNFANQGNITGTYDATTGSLTLSGTDTIANYQTALASITYEFNPGADPTGGGAHATRTISWAVIDGNTGNGVSNTGSSMVTAVHAAPTIAASSTVTYATGGTAQLLDAGIVVVDADSSGLLNGATIAIGAGFLAGDLLNFVNQGGIAGGYNSATGVLTLSGTASLANYQTALASVTFSSTSGDPTAGGEDNSRAISWTVSDGVLASATAGSTVNLTRFPPIVTGTGQQVTTDALAMGPFAGVTIADPNAGQTETVTVTLSNPANGTLSNPGSGILKNGSYVVTGSTLAVTSALRGLLFTPAAHQVTPGDAVTTGFTVTVTDSNGVSTIDSATTLTATAAHDAPVIAGTAASQLTSDIDTIHPFSGVAIGDADFGQTETVTVTPSNLANGTLSNLGTGVLNDGAYTVIGSDAAVSAALAGLIFTPTTHQVAPDGTVSTGFTIAVTDTAGDSKTDQTTSVIATATHTNPMITVGKLGQTVSDEGTVSPFAGMTVSDADFAQTETMTVTISPPANGTFTNLGSGVYDSKTGFYTVTGSDAVVTQALRGLVFNPTAHQVAPGGAVFSSFVVTMSDTAGDSADGQTASVIVTAANDPPSITGATAGQAASDEATVTPLAGIGISNIDFGQTETVTVTLSAAANGVLSNPGIGAYDAETGVYTVTGTDADVTQALRGLVFTPTAHQVAPDETVTTSFTVAATDTAGATATIDTASVIATAVNDPPTITNTKLNLGLPNQVSDTPFAALVISDPDVGHIDTVTVTQSNPTVGTLSNLAGGLYDAETGVYTVIGTASQVTAALNGLVFTPAALASGFIATTGFTVVATGPGGTASDDTIQATSVVQVLGLADNPTGDDTISVSTDGTGFAPPAPDKTNQAVVTAPVDQGTYTLPDGYQAAYLGGSADAMLGDSSVGGALLVGNTGNSTISASASGDTLTGGSGHNTFIASGDKDVINVTGVSTVSTAGSSATVFAGAGDMTLADTGTKSTIGLSGSSASVTLSGSGATVYAGKGDASLVDTGTGTMIGGFTGNMAATLAGSGSSVYGGSGALAVDVASTASGVVIGTGKSQADLGISGKATTVYGGAGSLTAAISGDNAVIGLDTGPTAMTLTGSGALIFGGSGSLSVLDLGTADTIGAGIGVATVTASGSDVVVVGGGGKLLFVGGMGSATVYGGTGSTTVAGGTGATTLYGGDGGVIDYTGGSGLATYQAGSGNETLSGAASTANMILNGGIDPGGRDRLVGGAGNDSLYAGTSADTFTGGGGANQFVFYRDVIAGSSPADVITDFNASDAVYLAGYGAGAADQAVSGAVSSGGSSTITLSDNTRITFLGVSDLGSLRDRIASF